MRKDDYPSVEDQLMTPEKLDQVFSRPSKPGFWAVDMVQTAQLEIEHDLSELENEILEDERRLQLLVGAGAAIATEIDRIRKKQLEAAADVFGRPERKS